MTDDDPWYPLGPLSEARRARLLASLAYPEGPPMPPRPKTDDERRADLRVLHGAGDLGLVPQVWPRH